MMRAYWHVSENFGDALTPYLIEKLTGEKPEWSEPAPGVYLVTGSVFGYNVKQGVVWGTGCAFKSDLDPRKLSQPSDEFRVVAIRGPLSRTLVREAGHNPVTYGDPGFVMPHLYMPNVEKKRKLGIIYSWVDEKFVINLGYHADDVINSLSPVERVVDFICSSEFIVSGCLHGIVLPVAYGIPVRYYRFSDNMVGDGFKFEDVYASLDVSGFGWIHAPDQAKKIAEELLRCCPIPRSSV